MEIFQTIWNLVLALWELVVELLVLAVRYSPLIAWVAWWLWGVNWKKLWPVLGRGAWAPLVLIMVAAALAWSRLAPSSCDCLGIVTIPNFWWQLGCVSLIVALTFLCGWVQEYFGWAPVEINLDPPAPMAHGHAAHGHH